MGNLVFQATLGGQVNLVGPNTASTFNLNVPAVAGTLVTTGDTGTVTNTMCATSVYTAPGTIGSGTPNSGAFTTLSASSTTTLSGGTANGVAYLNGSKVVTTGSALVFDGANLGLGVTPSGNFLLEAGTTTAAGRSFKLMTLTGGFSGGNYPFFGYNFRSTTTSGTYRYDGNDVASAINFASGIAFNIATSGTAGNAITWNQAMTLDASGRLQIGTTSTGAGQRLIVDSNGASTVYNSNFTFSGTTNTAYCATTWTHGQSGTATGYVGVGGSAVSNNAFANNFVVGTQSSSPLVFNTNDTERARITSSGNLLVGTTVNNLSARLKALGTDSTSSNWAFEAANSGDTTILGARNDGNVYAGNIGTGTGTALILTSGGYIQKSSSSIRYKKDVEPIDIGLNFILGLAPVKYNLKDSDIPQVGFIAEDFPDTRLVSESMVDPQDETKGLQREGVNYANLTAPLVKAIQEQQAIITQLQADVAALKG